MGRRQPTYVMKGFSFATLVVLVLLSTKNASSAPQQEQDPWLQVLNGGVQADERQDVAAAENQEDSELASQSQESVQPPPRPQQFQQPQRPLQRPPPRRPGPQRFPQGPPRRRPTRRPGRRTTTSRGILGSAVDAVNAAVGGVGERLSCTGTAQLLLDVTDNLTLSSGGERVATFSEDLHEVVGELTSSKIKTDDGMGKSITFIDRDSVGDTITRVHDNTSGTSRGIEGEDSLDGDIHGGHVEGLKHDLSHLLTVSLGVEGSLSKKDRLFLRGNTKFIVEGVVPDLLHIIPVGDDSMLNWVLEGKDTSLGLSLISNIGILLSHTDHHTLVARTANNGWEDSARSVISSETSLAHAGAIVNNKSSNVFVTHLGLSW